nr:9022_t:CDS:2 [Entrophospora candida]
MDKFELRKFREEKFYENQTEPPESWSPDSFGKWCLDHEIFNGEKLKIIDYTKKELEAISDNLFIDQDVHARLYLMI